MTMQVATKTYVAQWITLLLQSVGKSVRLSIRVVVKLQPKTAVWLVNANIRGSFGGLLKSTECQC